MCPDIRAFSGPGQGLVAEVKQTRSWPEVARDQGVSLATLMRRLRAVERTARKLPVLKLEGMW